MVIKNGRVLDNSNSFLERDILIENKTISGIGIFDNHEADSNEVIDASGLTAVPGLIDIHTHGGMGIDIVNCALNELKALTLFYASQGVTSFLPTIATVSKDKIKASLKKISELAKENYRGSRILGIHMEGPYISDEYRGAQNKDDIKIPDIDEFDEYYRYSNGTVKMVTIAPEIENALDMIKHLAYKGIVVSIGHTGAEYSTCIEAIKNGAKSATHFLNGMRGFHQHEPSIVGAALENDIYCEIICDGRHLHPGTVRMLLKVKGPDRLIMVTDSMMAAGLGNGIFEGFNRIFVKDGDARLEDGTRAGSTLTAINAVKNTISFSKGRLEEIVRMMTVNPAKLLSVYSRKGSLEPGKDADIVLLDDDFNIVCTIVEGEVIYQS